MKIKRIIEVISVKNVFMLLFLFFTIVVIFLFISSPEYILVHKFADDAYYYYTIVKKCSEFG